MNASLCQCIRTVAVCQSQEVSKILIFNAGQWMYASSCLIVLNFGFMVFQDSG